jgi:DNA-binding XRE family transcriptional regulator
MDKEKQRALEAAGFRVGTVQEFLGLTEEENKIVELRVAIGRRTRALRERRKITQQELATAIGSSQSRVAKLESADPGISLDLMFRGFFNVGGKVADLTKALGNGGRAARRPRASARPKPGKTNGSLVGPEAR